MILDPSEKSKQDVREIARYIAQDSPSAALRFLDLVEETYSVLSEFPEIGHTPIFDFVEGLKTVLVKGCKHHHVFYRITGNVIRIERVADGRRHLSALFQYLDEYDS